MPRYSCYRRRGGRRGATFAASPAFWLVDPLDGTREFTDGSNDFAVNIGLVRDGLIRLRRGRRARDGRTVRRHRRRRCLEAGRGRRDAGSGTHCAGRGTDGAGQPASWRRAQPDVLHAIHAGPRGAFLPPARPGLGGHRQRPQSRPGGDLRAGAGASRAGRSARRTISPTSRNGSPASSRAGSWGSLPMVTGATRR